MWEMLRVEYCALFLAAWVCPLVSGCSSDAINEPPSKDRPILAAYRDVSFSGPDFDLVGTLSLPDRADDTTRVPAVVLIGGSGALSRDEVLRGQLAMTFGFALPVFKLLASDLTASGFAVLRYDKRSCGVFNSCATNDYPAPTDEVTIDDFVADAVAAVQYMTTLPEVDASRISVIGHSEGGSLVPKILERAAMVRSGIMLSGPYRPIDEIIEAQLQFVREILTQEGVSSETTEEELQSFSELSVALNEMRAGTYEGGPVGGAAETFWLSLMRLGDENPNLISTVTQPLLAIGGGYDWNVPLSELDAWHASFALASNSMDRQIDGLDCMTHALNCISQPKYTQITPSDIGHELHPELAPSIVRFLMDH